MPEYKHPLSPSGCWPARICFTIGEKWPCGRSRGIAQEENRVSMHSCPVNVCSHCRHSRAPKIACGAMALVACINLLAKNYQPLAHHAVHKQPSRERPPPLRPSVAAAAAAGCDGVVMLQGHGAVHICQLNCSSSNGAWQQLDGDAIITHPGCLEGVLFKDGSPRFQEPPPQHRQQAPAAGFGWQARTRFEGVPHLLVCHSKLPEQF